MQRNQGREKRGKLDVQQKTDDATGERMTHPYAGDAAQNSE